MAGQACLAPSRAPLLEGVWRAALELAPETAAIPACAEAALRIAARLAERAQRVSPTHLLLDLGGGNAEEASALGAAALERLAALGMPGHPARMGIAPTMTLACLALMARPREQRLCCVLPEEAPALLAALPVARLAGLGALGGGITTEQIARLERYGLRTLGRLARLGEATLCRQFGRTTGAWLAAVAQGRDLATLQPTLLPERVALRLRLAEPPAAEQVRAGLPSLAARAAAALEARRRAAGGVALAVEAETGAVVSAQRMLPQPLAQARPLADLLATLLDGLLGEPSALEGAGITRLTLTLERLTPIAPDQTALWPGEAAARRRAWQARAAARQVAERLQRRHGRALLLQTLPHAPDAIFDEERYHAQPLDERAASDPWRDEVAPAGASHQKAPAAHRAPTWADTPVRLHWW
jgi:DNA polymerase IV